MDKQLLKFQLKGRELEMFDDLMEAKKVENAKTLLVILMTAELERLKKNDK